jgi:small subunit ribosomal protein SAe
MAPNNFPAALQATSQDIEMLLAAQCHIGSRNLQVKLSLNFFESISRY